MRHTIYVPRAHECEHGERTDRTTSEGTPICPLCRATQARRTPVEPLADWGLLSSGDDTWNDDDDTDAAPSELADLIRILEGNHEAITRVRSLLAEMEDLDTPTITCQNPTCAKPFRPRHPTAATCSGRCRTAKWRATRRAPAPVS